MASSALFVLLVMRMAAGLAVDSTRHKRERVRLQATLDRAVLAAADLGNDADPETVMRDHFAVAGLGSRLASVEAPAGLNHRQVTATATYDMPTLLMDLLGVETLAVETVARAEERVTDIGISLVLGVPGSMDWHGRLADLRTAAAEFVTAVLPDPDAPAGEGLTTISIAPYASTVDVGRAVMERYGFAGPFDHHDSYCIAFEDAAFEAARPVAGPALRQLDHHNPADGPHLARPATPDRRIGDALCPRAADAGAAETNLMLPLGADGPALRAAISGLQAFGSTSIDVGLLRGVGLLDPGTRSVVDALIAAGRVDPAASGRPYEFDRPDTLTVVVMMTDGEPTAAYALPPAIRSGPSNVWYDRRTQSCSVLIRGSRVANDPYGAAGPVDFAALGDADRIERLAAAPAGVDDRSAPRWYWIPQAEANLRAVDRGSPNGVYRDHPRSVRANDASRRNDWDLLDDDLMRLDHREVFEHFTGGDSLDLVTWPLYGADPQQWMSYAELSVFAAGDPTAARVRQRAPSLCQAAEANGVIVFAIGFELDRISSPTGIENARSLLQDCASSRERHYYDADDVEISAAFATIAGQIEQLRSTR